MPEFAPGCHKGQSKKVSLFEPGYFFLLTVWHYRLHGKDMCVNIYDVRLDDESPACGMNWPPEIRNVTDYLGVCYFLVQPGNC